MWRKSGDMGVPETGYEVNKRGLFSPSDLVQLLETCWTTSSLRGTTSNWPGTHPSNGHQGAKRMGRETDHSPQPSAEVYTA